MLSPPWYLPAPCSLLGETLGLNWIPRRNRARLSGRNFSLPLKDKVTQEPQSAVAGGWEALPEPASTQAPKVLPQREVCAGKVRSALDASWGCVATCHYSVFIPEGFLISAFPTLKGKHLYSRLIINEVNYKELLELSQSDERSLLIVSLEFKVCLLILFPSLTLTQADNPCVSLISQWIKFN